MKTQKQTGRSGALSTVQKFFPQERGLVIMSALLNFADWQYKTNVIRRSEQERGEMVREFLASHSDGENYFLQAEEIAERLSEPFKRE